jgi:hypothetical protein
MAMKPVTPLMAPVLMAADQATPTCLYVMKVNKVLFLVGWGLVVFMYYFGDGGGGGGVGSGGGL